MKSITVSITNIAPSKLFLFRWLCKLAKAKIHICKGKVRKMDGTLPRPLEGAPG